MDVPAFKIGSGECNNIPLLEHIASFGKPMILSTGMNTLESVRKSVAVLNGYKVPFALLHTTNLYPTPYHLVRLGAMTHLMNEFPEIPVGLSDHTISNHACFAAVALGASFLERHFTDHMQRTGPDIVCSMDEKETSKLINGAGLIFQMGGGRKEPAKEEQVTIDFAFSTVVAIKDIQMGEELTKDNIWVKRPGTGEIPAEKFKEVLGKRTNKFLPKDHHLKFSDFS
jgi:N-acetylneuraminate synthase